ncbi:MAG: peptide ABC transporter ATP-binding protein [Anaerolineales bacterium]|nr:ABC transporter ATP-binding protein [Anaerolineae bacterium]PWB50928.1 MAG: peptide ABC transporter ATP-binding protein [Anaerolineales bacterium]
MNNGTTPHKILEVIDLKTRFHIAEGTVHAVNGVSFHLNEGETIGVVGESGCGKSVTMMSIMGLIPIPPGEIASGQALFQGKDLIKLEESQMEEIRGRDIAMVFQDPMTAFNPVLSIGRQLSEPLRIHLGLEKEKNQQRCVELLEMVGIPEPANRLKDFPHQFSGGMRQRAMIAMALSCNPSILIADEPTTALDVTIQAQIVELVQSIRTAMNMSVIWITHDLGVVAEIAERVIVMYSGFIVEEALVDHLYEDARHPYTHALLAALPRVDLRREKRLHSIPGAPPNLLVEPKGCPFAPRCDHTFDRCLQEMPPLIHVAADNHQAACWMDLTTGKPR